MGNKVIKIMVIILLIITVLAVGVIAGYVFLVKGSSTPSKPKPPSASQLANSQYALQQITTNLQGGSVIQVTITLQADSSKAKDELDQRKAQVLDTVEGILHNTTQVDLSKPEGMNDLKKRIIQGINSYMQDGKVTDVFYANPIVQ